MMQDLDFEELDKAVNSLMPQPAAGTNTDRVVADNLSPQSMPITVPAPSTNIVERPTTGRFMDVVHPSSDMRSPLNMSQRPPVQADPVSVPSLQSRPIVASTVVSTPPADNVNNWAGLPNYPVNNEAPESPFLSEAKVEKRPLGAFSNDNTSTLRPVLGDIAAVEPQLKTETTNPLPAIGLEDNKIPEELDDSLLKVESDSSTRPSALDPNINPLSQGPMNNSIGQQYTTKPNVVSSETGNIYDTSSYNKAVTKKPGKKSGWMLVLWIVLLLIIGAGSGVAFYYFAMPNLPGLKLPF